MIGVVASPGMSYNAAAILRADALTVGERVTVLLGSGDSVGTDSDVVYIVTDQYDKKGNILLVRMKDGTTAYTTASTIFARY